MYVVLWVIHRRDRSRCMCVGFGLEVPPGGATSAGAMFRLCRVCAVYVSRAQRFGRSCGLHPKCSEVTSRVRHRIGFVTGFCSDRALRLTGFMCPQAQSQQIGQSSVHICFRLALRCAADWCCCNLTCQ